VLTLFPAIFESYLGQSILDDASRPDDRSSPLEHRDWSQEKHQKVDDRPVRGGPGMVLMAQPVIECIRGRSGEVRSARQQW